MRVDLNKMLLPVKVGGLTFRNPFYVGSGPVSKSIEHLLKADAMGWAGASIKLTFDPVPYVSLDPRYGWFEDQGFLSFSAETRLSMAEGLELIRQGRRQCRPDFLVMANITYVGDKPGVQGWVDMARRFEAAGAHIVELNMCCPNMSYNVRVSGTQDTAHQTGASLGQNAEAMGHIVGEVRKGIRIPLFVKLTPEGGRIAQVAKACFESGADAVGGTANRLGVPLVDLDDPTKSPYRLQKEPSMSCLCGPWLRPLAFRDVYEMRKLVGPKPRLTCAGGIMDLRDCVTAVSCGADLLVVCSGILLKGFEMLPPLMAEIKAYLKEKNLKHFSDLRDGLVHTITPANKLTVFKGHARKKSEFLRGPCQAACPFSVPAQDYVTLIAEGDFQRAWRMITSRSPLQSICGWVCSHPCESECTRVLADEAIRIRDLKRFVLEYGAKKGWKPDIDRAAPRKEKVAVIGAGPAGLSAAWHLARAGYKVTVFEARPKAGGMLRYAIPRFRLPMAALDAEIETFKALGVEFRTGRKFGVDITRTGLKAEKFQAIVLAMGASAGLPLGVPGEEAKGCMSALEFLRKAAASRKVNIGKRVAVIGGGFTAVDAARAARRLGAEDVYILYRRTRNEMPATFEEVDGAEAEGVKIMYLVSPKEILSEKGKAVGIRMVNHVLAERDASGRRRPMEAEGTEFTLEVDAVISAVSQEVAQGARELGVTLTKGTVATRGDGVSTSMPGVFAAGDAATGPDSIIAAVASGHRAATAADAAIAGPNAFLEPDPILTPADKSLVIRRNAKLVRRDRVALHLRPAAERVRDFNVIQRNMTEAEAVAEASRCLRCGCSVTCGLCARICSSFAIAPEETGRQERINQEKCHACGMCAQLCPNRNIEIVAQTVRSGKE